MRNIVNALLLRGSSVLLARRSLWRKAYPDLWSFPGGHVEQSETFEHALIREAREEIGIVPVRYAALKSISDRNAPRAAPVTYHMYTVTLWEGGEPVIKDNEHSKLEWFPLPGALQLPDLALEEYRPLLKDLLRSLK
jgi:8-oxo-dGTP diphosphatase